MPRPEAQRSGPGHAQQRHTGMHRLFLFLKKCYVFLLFVILETAALHIYMDSTPYSRARILAGSNWVVRGMGNAMLGAGHFFMLGKENRLLTAEIAELHNRLELLSQESDTLPQPLAEGEIASYIYTSARVINNSTNLSRNYFVINKGLRDGLSESTAVLTPDMMMAGYVVSCSEKFSVCMSVLHSDFRASGKLKGSDSFGSVSWDGRRFDEVSLTEIPKYAELHEGDTIVTTGYSFMFPAGIFIGTVKSFRMAEETASYDVTLRLGADLNSLRNVVLVKFVDAEEAVGLLDSVRRM